MPVSPTPVLNDQTPPDPAHAAPAQVTLPERLAALKREHQLTFTKLAERSGLSEPFLKELETGRSNPSYESLLKLAAAYRLSPQQLIAGVAGYDTPGLNVPVRRVNRDTLPPSLRTLCRDASLNAGLGTVIDDDWLRLLLTLDHRGRRPKRKDDWFLLFRLLQRILTDDPAPPERQDPTHP